MIDLSHPAIQRVAAAALRKGVALEVMPIPHTAYTAEQAAEAVDAELGQIVSSIVFVAARPGGGLAPVLCLVSGANQVDPALVATVAGEVSVRVATAHEAHRLTGYSIGGIPPFGHGREVRTLMDRDLGGHEWVWAAAGTHSAMFRVAPRTLRMLSNAVVAPVAMKPRVAAAPGPDRANELVRSRSGRT